MDYRRTGAAYLPHMRRITAARLRHSCGTYAALLPSPSPKKELIGSAGAYHRMLFKRIHCFYKNIQWFEEFSGSVPAPRPPQNEEVWRKLPPDVKTLFKLLEAVCGSRSLAEALAEAPLPTIGVNYRWNTSGTHPGLHTNSQFISISPPAEPTRFVRATP